MEINNSVEVNELSTITVTELNELSTITVTELNELSTINITDIYNEKKEENEKNEETHIYLTIGNEKFYNKYEKNGVSKKMFLSYLLSDEKIKKLHPFRFYLDLIIVLNAALMSTLAIMILIGIIDKKYSYLSLTMVVTVGYKSLLINRIIIYELMKKFDWIFLQINLLSGFAVVSYLCNFDERIILFAMIIYSTELLLCYDAVLWDPPWKKTMVISVFAFFFVALIVIHYFGFSQINDIVIEIYQYRISLIGFFVDRMIIIVIYSLKYTFNSIKNPKSFLMLKADINIVNIEEYHFPDLCLLSSKV